MSDNFGPQQGQGGWQQQPGQQPEQGGPQQGSASGWQGQPQQPQQGWQGQPQQGWQGQPQQGWQGQPQQGQPQQGWQGQPQQGQPQQGWQPQGPQGPKRGSKKLGVIITAAVVVIALAAGLTIWLVSKKGDDTALGGQATPQAAANDMLLSLADKDPIGVAQQLDPTEAQLFADMSGDVLAELKRLEIVKPDAAADNLTGTAITMKDLTFDDSKEEKVNDHVTIVKLTGGTVTVKGNDGDLPFTDKIKKAMGSDSRQFKTETKTYDIAEQVKDNGSPIRIATVKRGDKWYPSLFYTAADYWLQDAKKDNPELDSKELAAPIERIGAGSPEEAVTGLIDQAVSGKVEGVIGMLAPDEMGVLYDYGRRILAASGTDGDVSGAVEDLPKFSDLKFRTSAVTGGTKVSLSSATVEVNGQKIVVNVDAEAGKLTITAGGKTQELTVDSIMQMVSGSSEGMGMPPQVADIVKREFKQLLNMGVVTTQVDGKWYVSPLRTFSDVMVSLLKGLEPGDVDYLLQMAGR